jgi:hypothetical protein
VGILEGDKYLIVLAVFGKVDAHALEAVSGEQGNERRIILLHLVSNEFEGLPHSIFYHLLFGLLDLFKPLIEVAEYLREEGQIAFLEGCLHG